MITSEDAATIVGSIDSEATPVEPQPRHRDGRMPLELRPNWFSTQSLYDIQPRVPDAPRPTRTPVEGQEILR